MTQPTPGAGGPGDGGISGRLGSAWRGDGSREPGSRRARLLGLVSSVKEVYQTNYASLGNTFREMIRRLRWWGGRGLSRCHHYAQRDRGNDFVP